MNDNEDSAKPKPDPSLTLQIGIEAQAARLVLDSIQRTHQIDEEDAELLRDTIEGETDLFEAIRKALARLDELEAHDQHLRKMSEEIRQRRERFRNQTEGLRLSIQEAMDIVDQPKIEFPEATLSLRNVPPSVVVMDETEIPTQFWKRQDPVLDKRKLLDYLKRNDGKCPGATLSNPRKTVSIKRG